MDRLGRPKYEPGTILLKNYTDEQLNVFKFNLTNIIPEQFLSQKLRGIFQYN